MSQEVIEITEREIEIVEVFNQENETIEIIESGPQGPTGPQPDINYTVVSSARTLEAADLIAADTSGGAFTLTLPLNPSNGDAVDIFDFSETFDTNPLTIARNGSRIESLEENLVCNVEGAYFTLIYTGATRGWQVLPRYATGEFSLTTQGDMLYRGPLVNERLPIGTAGQILKVNSTSTAPEWGAAPATGVTSVTGTAPIASSGGAIPAISISAATTGAAGSMSSADKTKLDGIAANANNYTHPNHSGEVTSSGDGATTIANDVVTNAKLANMATATIKGRATAGTGDPEDLSASSVRTLLNTDQVTDARTPTAHTHELAALAATGAESDDILASDGDGTASWRTLSTFIGENVGPADIGAAQASHTHGNLSNDGKIGTTANLPLKTGTNGVIEAGAFGTSAGSFCAGDDARLSDARTPSSTLAHAASHAAGVKASSSVQVEGVSTPVLVRANAAGTAGNSITLTFNGSQSIINRLSAWNSANPSNQATLIWGDGSQIPENGEGFTLSGGVAGGSDPIPSFSQLAVNDGNDVSLVSLNGASSDIIEFESGELTFQHTGGNDTPYIAVQDESNNEALLGLRQGEMFLQGSNPNVRIEQNGGGLANILMASAKLVDEQGPYTATIDVQGQLTDDVTLTIPDASGTIALQSEAYDFYYATAPSGATGGSGSAWVWNIPSWSTMQVITMIGAGGGGGGGRIGASGTVCSGGGGGGSGAYGTFITRITGGDQIEVLVGAGGAGAAARGPAVNNGFTGTAGGNTSVRWVTPNITLRTSSSFGAGGAGGGGQNGVLGSNGTAGTAGTGATILGTAGSGATGITGSLVGNAGGGANNNSTQGGRAGGSIDATPTAFNGGTLSGSSFTDVRESFLLPSLSPKIGTGAKGGNASITADAQAGDNAGGLGGGGGGGGAALSGFLGGAGGNGGDGFVRIHCF